MPRGSSSDSRNSGTRDTPATSKVRSSSRIGSFSSTAMMSARGTMTSWTRKAPKRRMRRSISRSSVEKACPSPAAFSSASSVARSVGAPGMPSRARSAESQPCAGSPATWAAGWTPSDLALGDLPLMAWARPGNGKTLMLAGRARGVGILEAERRQNLRLQLFHLDGLCLRFVVIADEVQKTVQDKMLNVVDGLEAALRGLPGNRLGRQHHITQVAIAFLVRAGARLEWEGEDIGWDILAPVGGIEATQQAIAAQHNGSLPPLSASARRMAA